MASGLLGFLGFGKREKPNLNSNFRELPQAQDAPLYGDLRDLAKKRINGGDLGFGDDFVSKAGNPLAKQMRDKFSNVTDPYINSEMSKRGINRSSIATDSKIKAYQSNESAIDSMMADFYKLNEMQKKTDQSEGIRVGENINSSYLNQGNNAANAYNAHEEAVTGRTVGAADARNQRADKMQDASVGFLMNTLVPGSGTAFTAATKPAQTQNSSQVKLAGSSNEEFETWLNSLFG